MGRKGDLLLGSEKEEKEFAATALPSSAAATERRTKGEAKQQIASRPANFII